MRARARLLAVALAVAGSLGLACDPGALTSASGDGGLGADKGGNCVTCHMAEYTHADPPHVDVKPMTCAVCHVQEGWRPSAVHHDFWPLTGAHQGRPDTQCNWCHKGTPAVFKGTTKECVGCHREDYEASTFPDHQTFPQKCAECHNTTSWRPAKHPPPPPAPILVPAATTTSTKPLPKGTKTPLAPPPPPRTTKPSPTPTVVPPPTSVPTTRLPDVISRPSRRR